MNPLLKRDWFAIFIPLLIIFAPLIVIAISLFLSFAGLLEAEAGFAMGEFLAIITIPWMVISAGVFVGIKMALVYINKGSVQVAPEVAVSSPVKQPKSLIKKGAKIIAVSLISSFGLLFLLSYGVLRILFGNSASVDAFSNVAALVIIPVGICLLVYGIILFVAGVSGRPGGNRSLTSSPPQVFTGSPKRIKLAAHWIFLGVFLLVIFIVVYPMISQELRRNALKKDFNRDQPTIRTIPGIGQ